MVNNVLSFTQSGTSLLPVPVFRLLVVTSMFKINSRNSATDLLTQSLSSLCGTLSLTSRVGSIQYLQDRILSDSQQAPPLRQSGSTSAEKEVIVLKKKGQQEKTVALDFEIPWLPKMRIPFLAPWLQHYKFYKNRSKIKFFYSI